MALATESVPPAGSGAECKDSPTCYMPVAATPAQERTPGSRLPRSSTTRPLRFRLLVGSAVVQLVMLALLIYNSIEIMEDRLIERTRFHLREHTQLLNAALEMPLADSNMERVQHVLENARREQGMSYLVLLDRAGRIVASTGWDPRDPLPTRDGVLTAHEPGNMFHSEVDVQARGEHFGKLAFGLSTAFLETARAELIRDNLTIGLLALVVSIGLMVALAYWLTRHLMALSAASARLASGDLNVRVPVHGRDEIAQLTSAFNSMAETLASRIQALGESEAKFTAIADYSYDCEPWISPCVARTV